MNTALYQELIHPSKFNMISASILIILIVLSVVIVALSLLRKNGTIGNSNETDSNRGKGF